MPGMNSGLNIHDPVVVSAFRAALLHQGLIALAIFALLSVVWVAVRNPAEGPAPAPVLEPRAHRVLRIGFGLLWLLDGLLQVQPGMAAGLPSQVIEPAAVNAPHWVQHLVNWAGTSWSYHPVQAGAAAVWIQIGIGLWLLAAPRGWASRLAGVSSVAWGLVVWVFGESFGGIFSPGLTWLTGAPGAALLYAVAGGLLVLPDRAWRSSRMGRAVLAVLGLFLAGMTVLQAWPGRGSWDGSTLASMVQSMMILSQPHAIATLVSGFSTLTRAHGFAVNLVAVIVMGAVALAFLAGGLTGRRDVARPALGAFGALSLAVWVLVQDLGFFGGLGTDPNSMIPFALLVVTGYLALAPGAAVAPAPAASWRDWRGRLRTATFGTMTSAGALGVIILGVVPLATAQASPVASTILAESIDGGPAPINIPAGNFTLTDQHGQQVSLSSMRGRVVLLTFLDPVCVSDCPLIAQEFRQAGQMLGVHNPHVRLVSVNVNPLYHQEAYIQAFDRQENLATAPDWEYLTGGPATLRKVYKEYGVPSEELPAGAMLGHNDIAFVIDPHGQLTEELDLDPGPGTAATESSFATELAEAVNKNLAAS